MKVLKNNFTLLEMLIAVIILVIISSVVVGIFRNTLENYKKGMSYSEITESISGVYMIMKNDLSRMQPIGDKKTVVFKPNEFSFVSLSESGDKKSYLELIRYKVDHETLMRGSVNYPGDIDKITQNMLPFLNGLKEMSFSYVFEKVETKKKKPTTNDNSDNINNEKKIGVSDEIPKKKKLKLPIIVDLTAIVENKKIEQYFSTSLYATYINAVPGTKTSSDSDKKDSTNGDSSDQSQNNSNENQ